ncbi:MULTISPECIES: hypothetical protein [Bacillus]|nr:hypothetical protein [Bacillus pseudomycoides]EEM07913.1 hypothetical protein bmyco0003_53960 [Bacillus pseudomycoides]MCR8861207.1 hypothetical protein [Bacillus pseudomycoides]MED1539507.1 hypothetical protein [Bacillus pseudomycoides]MED1625226.1 hypothetical protein [Bacillus pseudomycoides]
MYRNGHDFFPPHQKEKASANHVVFCIVGISKKLKWIYMAVTSIKTL